MLKINNERRKMIKEFSLPTYKEIPSVGLYLDQTSKYINDNLLLFPEMKITNSMISNYVKKDLIANPIKKQYYRDQIAYLLFITLTKSVLSLDETGRLFTLQKEKYDTATAYTYFASHFEEYFHQIFDDKEISTINDKDENKALLKNIIITAIRNIYLHELLNNQSQD